MNITGAALATHVVLVQYVNDVHLRDAVCFYASSEAAARGLAATLQKTKTINMPGTQPPYQDVLSPFPIIDNVVWSRL